MWYYIKFTYDDTLESDRLFMTIKNNFNEEEEIVELGVNDNINPHDVFLNLEKVAFLDKSPESHSIVHIRGIRFRAKKEAIDYGNRLYEQIIKMLN